MPDPCLESAISAHKDNDASYKKALEHTSTHGNEFFKDVTQDLIDEYNKQYGVSDREAANKVLSGSSEAKALFRFCKPQGVELWQAILLVPHRQTLSHQADSRIFLKVNDVGRTLFDLSIRQRDSHRQEKEITILPYREGNRVTRREINPTSLPRGLDLEHLALNLDMEQRLTDAWAPSSFLHFNSWKDIFPLEGAL